MISAMNSAKPISIWRRLAFLLAWPWELIPLLALFGWLYRQTMPPGISSWIIEGWDSAMLQITGSTWGIPHSPGYPLYTILSNLFVRLIGLLPGGADTSIVWRVSFWSTVTGLLTLCVLYSILRKLTRNRLIAFITSAILGASFIFWRGSIMAEVYSLNTLIFALTYWLAIIWGCDRRDRWLMILGLVLGTGMAHHRTAFVLPPVIALWVMLRSEQRRTDLSAGIDQPKQWQLVLHRWKILLGFAFIPLLSYLYLPWAAQNRVGQTWLYADTSDWNTFWFVVFSREWWGLIEIPRIPLAWLAEFIKLFQQQAGQITSGGVVAGMVGLFISRRYFWLFGPPLCTLFLFGMVYKVADLDSMLMPLTLTLCIGLGLLAGTVVRYLASWLIHLLRARDKELRGNKWLSAAIRIALSITLLVGAYFLFQPIAKANYETVDLSDDWQAVDLVEEVVAIARNGTPLTIIGQDNSVLPDLIYAKVGFGQPIEPLSTTTLSRMPEEESIALLRERLAAGHRVLVDIETINLGFIPWLNQAIEIGRIFLAPTGHPFLWELLPRPMPGNLPETEAWIEIPPGQLLEGRIATVAFHQRLIPKRTGCFLRLTLFWQLTAPLEKDYFVSVQPLGGETVLDKNDHLALMRGYLPTSQIQPGEIVRDEVDLLVRQPAALPGTSLVVNLFQVQGDQYPTFGEVVLPITVEPDGCSQYRY
jgi:hypothetical protein